MADGAGETPKANDRPGDKSERIVIKKYANRRLYNTGASAYVTLEHLAELVRKGTDFVVYDAKTNEDITRQVLTQIIFDEETRGQNILPIQFLRQLIKMYGDQMQAMMAPAFLEASMDSFAKQQDAFRDQWTAFGGGKPGVNPFEDQIRANMAMFDSAMKMFNPFAAAAGAAAPASTKTAEPTASSSKEDEITEMRRRMEEMQSQIEKLAKR